MTEDLTAEKLQERCEFWQKVLRLQDWTVKVKLADLADMDAASTMACILTHADRRNAVLSFVRHEQRGKEEFPNSDDHVLVHELLHIYFDDFDTGVGTRFRQAEEQAVDALAGVIVGLQARVQEGPA